MARDACTADMYKRADASLSHAAHSWHSLRLHQKSFAPCDDGALAEGYSDAIVTLLAHHWDQFGAFVALSQRHPAFRRWAIRHIDSSASSDDLRMVARNAARCSGDMKTQALCREVGRAAADAISS